MNWIEIEAGKYNIRSGANRISTCQIECQVSFHDIISHPPEGEWAKIAPLRVLSFDIECAGRPGVFPEASVDPVTQIANVAPTYGILPFGKIIYQVPQNHSFEMCLQSTLALKSSELKSWNTPPRNPYFSLG